MSDQIKTPSFEAIQEEISNMLSINEDEMTDEDRSKMDAYLDLLGQQEADKVDSFGRFLKLETLIVEAVKEESKRLAAKAKTVTNKINYLKSRYISIMQAHGIKKVSGKIYQLSLRSTPAVLVDVDPATLPDVYQNVKTTIDANKIAIKEALKNGANIPGCKLYDSISLMVR